MAQDKEIKEEVWVTFLRKHWKVVIIIISGVIAAAVGGLFVFLWVKDVAQATGLVPATTLGDWTIGYCITFLLNVLLWEFIIIGLPLIAVAAVIFLQWWNKLPNEEKEEYQKEPKKRTSRSGLTAGGGGGIVWGLTAIVWLILVYTDGNWDTIFNEWTFDYLVYSTLTAFLWVLLIAGVPVGIFVIWWLRREFKRPA